MSGSPDLKAQKASATHGADVAAVKAEKKKAAWKKEWRMHLTAFIGETLGTAIFLFLGEGIAKTANLGRTASDTQTAAPLDSQTIMMISVGFGMSLLTTAWLFYRITGGLFNPAITLALWLCGVLTSLRACLLFVAQMIGGIIAAALVLALTPQGSAGVNVVNNTLNDVTLAQGFFLEMLGTSVLVFSVLMLAVEKHRATYLAPVGIGLTIFAVHLFLVSWTGCAVSPTRAFGPAVVSGNFPQEHWIYWIGPMVGGILAVVYFQILKMFNYTSCVLDQDSDKEVTGLRPVHMRVYKRLAGHKDWSTDHQEKRLVLLRRRRQRRAQRKEMREANEADFGTAANGYGTDTDNENDLANITSRSTLGDAGTPGIHAITSSSTLAAASPTIQTRDMAAAA